MMGYFALFFVMGLLFYAGSYNYGADVRYSLLDLSADCDPRRCRSQTALGAGSTASHGETAARALSPVRSRFSSCGISRAYARRRRKHGRREPTCALHARLFGICRRNSFVLTHNPGMFHVWGVNAGQMSLMVSSPTYVDQLSDRFAGGIYLHWNFWCNVADPVQQEFCRLALSRGPSTLVSQYRERDYRYAMYRLGVPPAVAYKD